MEYIIIKCPHCKDDVFIYLKELNCQIFRHGVYKNNYEQINPHLEKKMCDYLLENSLIYGCSKPFKIVNQNNNFSAEICDYI